MRSMKFVETNIRAQRDQSNGATHNILLNDLENALIDNLQLQKLIDNFGNLSY